MRKLRTRGKKPRSSSVQLESLESRLVLSLSPAADAALAMTIGNFSPAAAAANVVFANATNPVVTSVDPANNSTDINRGTKITFSLQLVNGTPIDVSTLNTDNVKLNRTSDGQFVNCNINTDAAGAVIVMQPTALLAADTQYTVRITTGLKDTAARTFVAFTSTFKTGTGVPAQDPNIVFSKTTQANSTGHQYTSLAWGPDNKLYAGTLEGQILRFTVGSGGTLSTPEVINTVNNNNTNTQFIIGLEFDPAATAGNPILWISHTDASDLTQNNAPDWTGRISKLSGANLDTYQNYVTGLPRSVRDHVVDQLHFGPDGALYFCVPSMNAMGDVDPQWQRADHPLSGDVLRLDLSKLGSLPLDAKTSDGGGTYDPSAANAPLTVYATGIRNGYDFVFHSNGHMYMVANGSAAGGNTPAGPGNHPPAMQMLTETMHDYVFDIKQGGYYGQPNLTRGQYILNGGNPTSGVDRNEVAEYPVGTQPDPNYRFDAFDFGQNYAPTGVIEYHGNAFNGALDGRMLVTRYSGGDDIFILTPSHTGNTVSGISGVNMDGLNDPTDIIEDPNTGNLYVCQLGTVNSGAPRNLIVLFKPDNPPVLTKLQLINADIGVSLGALRARETFNLADLPTRNLSIKALGTNVARVMFDLDGAQQDETDAPFALKGNNPDGSYKPWTPTTGGHVLSLTPYNANGTAGATVQLQFWTIDTPKPFNAFINFQPVDTPYARGYKPDWGRLYALRGNGMTYGWNKSAQGGVFDNNLNSNQALDTGVHFGGRQWNIGVPNGTYSVFILGGDEAHPNATYNVAVEGVPALVGSTDKAHPFIGKTLKVTVTDNTITVAPLAGNVNQSLNVIQIVAAS